MGFNNKIIHLEDEEELKHAISNVLLKYTRDGTFKISNIGYEKKYFGNVAIKLSSKDNINIGIYRDKWFVEGILEINGIPNHFLLKDVLHALKIKEKLVNPHTEIIEALDKMMELITRNWQRIVQGFDIEHRDNTLSKINEIQKKRVGKIIKL